MSYTLSWRRPKPTGKPVKFEGRYFNKNCSTTWSEHIPILNVPIRYLEIGVADGGNAIHFANSYGKHPDSKIHCVDPWMDYDEYDEYKGEQEKAWNTFNKNIQNSGSVEKFVVHRGFSDAIVPTFENESFDIIFVDGNHETEFVYKDGVMALEKVKKGGYIIFDDYCFNTQGTCIDWAETAAGIDMFLKDYSNSIEVLEKSCSYYQVIVRKNI
jgi:predicted O-methyltransferase YrrM